MVKFLVTLIENVKITRKIHILETRLQNVNDVVNRVSQFMVTDSHDRFQRSPIIRNMIDDILIRQCYETVEICQTIKYPSWIFR